MNFVAAMLLLVMKTEEEAFWMLAVLVENVLFDDCYSENLYGCLVEQRVFKDLFKKKLPRFHALLLAFCPGFLHHWVISNNGWEKIVLSFFLCPLKLLGNLWTLIFSHVVASMMMVGRLAARLEEVEFDVSLVTTEWFLCLFAKSLPSEVYFFPIFKCLKRCWNFGCMCYVVIF